MTNQPVWKYAGHIGDTDPIAYGGGYVYTDKTGVYAPELTWFEPAPDEEWHKTEGTTPLQVYRVMLERDSTAEWWYDKLESIASYIGQTLEDVQIMAKSSNPVELAQLYSDLFSYFGVHEFDSYPNTMTEDEAYAQYAEEMKASQ